MGGPGGGMGMMPAEKAKDFKGSLKKLFNYMGGYRVALLFVMIFAACSTVFNVAGPKVLGKATTALFDGLSMQVKGTGSISSVGFFSKS